MQSFFSNGGLPGICFICDGRLRDLRIDAQLETLLDRDLRMVQTTTLPNSVILELCRSLAAHQGRPIDYTQLSSESGISTPTIKKLLYALEAIFLIRQIPIEGGGRRGVSVFFEDQAEANRLAGDRHSNLDRLTHFAFHQLRAQFAYRLGARTDVFQYRTRGGAIVPICFRNPEGVLGIIPIEAPEDASTSMGSANSFLKSYSSAKVLLLHQGQELKLFHSRVLSAPIGAMV